MANLIRSIPILLLLLLAVCRTKGLRCWMCSTDSSPESDCGDPFQVPNIDGNTGNITYGYDKLMVQCDADVQYSPSVTKLVCLKLKKKDVHGNVVVTRGCVTKRANDTSNTCPGDKEFTDSILCMTCDGEGCNGATAVSSAAIALLLAPLALFFK